MNIYKIGDVVIYNNELHKITQILFNMINYYILDNNVLCIDEDLQKFFDIDVDVL